MSRLSSLHPEDAKGSGYKGWVKSNSRPDLDPPRHPHFDSAVSPPASCYSAVCTCYYYCSLQPPIFLFNASLPLCVKPQPQFLKECPQTSGQPPAANQHPDHPCKIANLPKKTTQLLRLWETENISTVFTCSQYFSPFFFFSLCLCDSDCQHTDTSYIETVSVQISLSWSSSLDCQMLSLNSQSAQILERSWDSLTALEGVNFSLWAR